MNVTFQMQGIDKIAAEVTRRFARLEAEAAHTMEGHGMGMMEQTAELSPFDTGFMASHVQYTPAPDLLSFTVGWHRADFDAAGFEPYYFYQEFGTQRSRAQPSLGPVAHQGLPALEREVRKTMRRTMSEGR